MDDNNNKLEDFFNQSLNQFDDSPSDAVWEGLQKRLDDERSYWQIFSNAILKYLPYILFFLVLGSYHFYAQNKINKISQKIESLEAEKSSLGIQLNDCSNKTKTLLTDLQLQSASLLEKETTITALQENSKSILTQKPKINYYTNPIPTIFPQPNQNTKTQNTFIDNKNLEENKPLTLSNSIAQTAPKDLKTIAKNDAATNRNNSTNKGDSKKLNPLITHKKISFFTPSPSLSFYTFKNPLVIDPIKNDRNSAFRIGCQYKAFYTYTKTGTGISFGQGQGLRMEWVYKNNFALTGSAHFYTQEYHVSNSGNTIPLADILQYPGGVDFGNNVTQLEVHSHYLDFPLGVKWSAKKLKNGFDLYINPALVWQLYLSQKYTYTLSGVSKIERRNKQKFGYLGSANIQIGFEKKIRNKLIWQIGLWGEKSLIPLGVEEQAITMFGLNTAILFQK